MVKWELTTYLAYIQEGVLNTVMPTVIWRKKKEDTGKTAWEELNALANEGWELVSVTPVTCSENTKYLLYTFKRPKSDVA